MNVLDCFQSALHNLNMMDPTDQLSMATDSNDLESLTIKLGRGGELRGLECILDELLEGGDLRGRTEEQEELLFQRIEYILGLDYLLGNQQSHLSKDLKALDTILESSTYIAGHSMTFADFVLYQCIYPKMKEMSFQEKEKYVNLSRWFKLVQNDERIRGANDKVIFSRMSLYGS